MAKKKTTSKRVTTKPAAKAKPVAKPKAKAKPKGVGERSSVIDATQFGIDIPAIVQQIRPHLDGMTQAEIAESMGTSAMVISHYLTGHRVPSIGALAALAAVSGGSLSIDYSPPADGSVPTRTRPPQRSVRNMIVDSKKRGEA